MVKEIIFLVKELFLVDYGNRILKYKVSWLYLTVIYLMDVLEIIYDIKVLIGIVMVMFIKEHGGTMWNKDLENCI